MESKLILFFERDEKQWVNVLDQLSYDIDEHSSAGNPRTLSDVIICSKPVKVEIRKEIRKVSKSIIPSNETLFRGRPVMTLKEFVTERGYKYE